MDFLFGASKGDVGVANKTSSLLQTTTTTRAPTLIAPANGGHLLNHSHSPIFLSSPQLLPSTSRQDNQPAAMMLAPIKSSDETNNMMMNNLTSLVANILLSPNQSEVNSTPIPLTRNIRQIGQQQQQQQPLDNLLIDSPINLLNSSFSWLDILLVAILISLILISIVGNCLVCVAIFTDRRLRKLGNAFIVSLAIADLFVSCLVMTFALCNDLMNYWIFGDWFCDLWISFDIMCCTASILNLCAISLDRFIHIKDCLLYNQWMTKRVALGAVLMIWFISALVSIVPINLGWHRPPSSRHQHHQHHLNAGRALHRRSLADPYASANLQLDEPFAPLGGLETNTNDLGEGGQAGGYAMEGNREEMDDGRHQMGPGIFEPRKLNYQQQSGPPNWLRPPTTTTTNQQEIIKLAQANDLLANFTTHRLQHERPLGGGSEPPSSLANNSNDAGRQQTETKSATSLTLSSSLPPSSGALVEAATVGGPNEKHSTFAAEVRTSSPSASVAGNSNSSLAARDNRRRPIGRHHNNNDHDHDHDHDHDENFLMNSQVEVTWAPSRQRRLGALEEPAVGDEDTRWRNNINIKEPPQRATSALRPSEYIDELERPTGGSPSRQQQQQQQFNQVELNPTSRPAGSGAQRTGGLAPTTTSAAQQTVGKQIKVPEETPNKSLGRRRARRQTTNGLEEPRPASSGSGRPANSRQPQQTPSSQGRPDTNNWATGGPPSGAGPTRATTESAPRTPDANKQTGELPQCMLILTPTYAVVSSTISFYIPCIIMLGLYSKLFACARRHVKNIRAMARAPAPLVSAVQLPPLSSGSTTTLSANNNNSSSYHHGHHSHHPSHHNRHNSANKATSCSGVNSDHNESSGAPAADANRVHSAESCPASDKQSPVQLASGRVNRMRGDKSNEQLASPKVAWQRRACRTWIKFGRLKGRPGEEASKGRKLADVERGDELRSEGKVNNNSITDNIVDQQMTDLLDRKEPGETKAGENEPFLSELNNNNNNNNDQLTVNSLTGAGDSLSLSRQVTCNSSRSITFRLNLSGLTNKHREHQQSSHSLATTTTVMTHHQQQQQEKSTQTHKAAITLGIIMGTFLFCWVPFFCLNIIKAYCVDCIPSSMFRFFTWLGYANSALNPIIYGIHNSEFRNAFNRIFFKHLSLKNGRQYLNRRFSYDLRPHHQPNHRTTTNNENNNNNITSTSVTTNNNNNNNNNNRPRQTLPQTPTSNQLERTTTTKPLMMEGS